MPDDDKTLAQQIALFRYGVIADLLHLKPGKGELYKLLAEKSAHPYLIPGTLRTRVAPETMRDWLRLYRQGGFDALKPKGRADSGSTHLAQAVADLLCTLKEEHPQWPVRLVIEKARDSNLLDPTTALPLSTVHRMLARRGLMDKSPTEPSDKDRRHFEFAHAGELWMSDVMHGPAVCVDGRGKRKTYLIAFLDDATRVIPHAAFALSENLSAFLPVFKTAIERRGIPRRLFVDNGAAYRSHHLAVLCARLGITLIHARPYQPAGKGKQERFFRTVRMQLISQLTDQDLRHLDALNRRLWSYIEAEYHQAPHRGLDGEAPLERWARLAAEVRLVSHDTDLDDLFLLEEKRRVNNDRTVSLFGRLYELDAALVGSTVTLRHDPARPGATLKVVAQGKPAGEARLVDAYANCFVKRQHRGAAPATTDSAAPAPSSLRLSKLTGPR
jgi:transposase InsO family protein